MPESLSPIAGAFYVAIGDVHYAWEKEGEYKQTLFPYQREDDANAMAAHMHAISADPENVATYRNVRVAMVQFAEIPDDYNSIDPLF